MAYPTILVLGIGRFHAAVGFLVWLRRAQMADKNNEIEELKEQLDVAHGAHGELEKEARGARSGPSA